MTEEPKGTTLTDFNEELCLQQGTPINVLRAGKPVHLTRRLAVMQALESPKQTTDKFKAFDLGMRFMSANGEVSIDSGESEIIKAAIEEEWPQPGIYVPLCRWLEGG